MVFDTRRPDETGKSGKITFPDTRKRTIIVGGGEYNPPTGNAGLRTKPQGPINRFDPATGVKVVAEAAEVSIHGSLNPTTPQSPSATATGSSTIDVDATIGSAGNDGILIERSTTGGGAGFSQVADIAETALPWEDTGRAASTQYFYRLRGYLWDGTQKFSTYTPEVSATTGAGGSVPNAVSPAPTISEISRTATTMTLEATWADVADETSYEWWAGSNDGTTWEDGTSGMPNTLAADATSVQYTATRKNADHGTFFCVRPCNGSGCAEQTCNSFTVAGNLTAPSGLAATNPAGSDVDLDWTDMAGASVADETAIERRLLGGSFTEIDTVPFGTTHYDDDALADGDYEYRVRHRDTGTGNTSSYSANDSVGINSGGGGSSYPNEPAGLTTIARQGWSNAVVSSPAVESDFTSPETGEGSVSTGKLNRMEIVSDGTAPVGSGQVMRGKFPDGFGDGASPWRFDLWGPSISFGGVNDYSEIYVSYWIKIEGSDFENQTVGTKIYYVAYGSTVRNNHSFAVFSGNFSDQTIMTAMPVPYNISEMNPDGSDSGGGASRHAPNLTNEKMQPGQWVQIEAYYKINDINPTQDNGEFKQWVNGVQTHAITGLRYRSTENPRGFYHLQFTPVYGGNSGDVRTRDDYWRVAEVYISGKE